MRFRGRRLSKNRFAGFCPLPHKTGFAGTPFYLIGSGRPTCGLPRHTPHSRRGPEAPWFRPAGRFRQIFAKIWRATVFFPAHVREKHSIRKSLRFRRLFQQAEPRRPFWDPLGIFGQSKGTALRLFLAHGCRIKPTWYGVRDSNPRPFGS